jgi:hypothetical protein
MFRTVNKVEEPVSERKLRLVAPANDERPREIPYAIRWLVPKGERFANFDILNDNDTQLDYWRRFGHIYAVGIPTKKWRLVVVSDPELLDEVAGNEDRSESRSRRSTSSLSCRTRAARASPSSATESTTSAFVA